MPDWQAIIKKGEPWTDPDFPPDNSSLFIDGKQHRNHETDSRRAKWTGFQWARASTFFEGQDFCVFHCISPEDVKQGNIDNCQFMGALSGLAADDFQLELQQ